MRRFRTTFVLSLLLLAGLPVYAEEESGHSEAYRQGQEAIDDKDWEEASRIYGRLAAARTDEADAALYWKAYADYRRNMKKESLEGIGRLLTSYPQSAWADDAKKLELDIRNGKTASASEEDEELTLYALDGLMQVDAQKAVPILEKFLAGNHSKRTKERALFVLSQSDSPRAREILVKIAKTGQPVELRREAIRTLGISAEPEDIAALAAIAKDTSASLDVREAVVEAYLISGRSGELLALARSDPDPGIRRKAIEALGASGELGALRQLWATEKDPALRAKLLESFGVAGDIETLAKAARESTTDKRLRKKAIEGIGIISGPEASRTLRQLYKEFTDPDDKKKVVESLMVNGDEKALIEMFRAERDPAMKKIIFQNLTIMGGPEIERLILEQLGEKP